MKRCGISSCLKHQVWKMCCGGQVILIPLHPAPGFYFDCCVFYFNISSRVHDTLNFKLAFQGKKTKQTKKSSKAPKKTSTDFSSLEFWKRCFASSPYAYLVSLAPKLPQMKESDSLIFHLNLIAMNAISSTYQTINQAHYTNLSFISIPLKLVGPQTR